MKISSNLGKLPILHYSGFSNKIIGSACAILFAYLLISTVVETAQLIYYQARTYQISESVTSIDKQIADATEIWKNIDIDSCMTTVNYKEILQKYIIQCNIKKLKSASITLDEATNKISVSTIADEQQ
jgi:hypothetical protein